MLPILGNFPRSYSWYKIIYNPAMFEMAEHSEEFSFKFSVLTRTLKSVTSVGPLSLPTEDKGIYPQALLLLLLSKSCPLCKLCFQSSYIFQLKENGKYAPTNTTACFFCFQLTSSASFQFHRSKALRCAASTACKHVWHLLFQVTLQRITVCCLVQKGCRRQWGLELHHWNSWPAQPGHPYTKASLFICF